MSQQIEGRTRTWKAASALGQYLRVYDNGSDQVALAGATTAHIGWTDYEVFAVNDPVSVSLHNLEGTQKMVASGSITKSNSVYAAASGKIASSGTLLVGTALETSTADGDIIEVLPAKDAASRGQLTQEDLAVYALPLEWAHTWDNRAVNIPASAGTDDMGLSTGTAGTDAHTLVGADAGATTATNKVGFAFPIPVEYVPGQTVTLRVKAGMEVIAEGTGAEATLDASVYRQAAPTVDVCATAAQDINSATLANMDFTITPTNVVVGDILDIILTAAVTDADNSAANINAIVSGVSLLLDVKG